MRCFNTTKTNILRVGQENGILLVQLVPKTTDKNYLIEIFNNFVNLVEPCGGKLVDIEGIERELVESSLNKKPASNEQIKSSKVSCSKDTLHSKCA